MVSSDEGIKAAKRKLESSKAHKVSAREEDKTAWFMDQMRQKDARIANLTTMMEGTRQQLLALQASLDQLTTQKAEGSEGSTEGENL